MNLKDKKIIVTGGAGEIGGALIKKLLNEGAIVVAVDLNASKFSLLLNEISEEMRKNLFFYQVDVRNFNSVKNMIDDFFSKQKEIDVLINNAAILKDNLLVSAFKGIKKLPLENWTDTIDTNLNSYFYFAREVAEKMLVKNTRGVIINVSSISAVGNVGQSAYSASKAAVNALTNTWARELAFFKIRVAGIAPGVIDTEMPKKSMKENLIKDFVSKTPMKRLGTKEEIADAMMFILHNDFFCGRTLEIDGGLRI